MKLKMKKNIQTLTAIVGLGILSASMVSCGDNISGESIFDSYNKYFPKRSEVVDSSGESIFDSYDKYFPKRSEVVDSSGESIFDSYDKYFPKRKESTFSSDVSVSKSTKVKKLKFKKTNKTPVKNKTPQNDYTQSSQNNQNLTKPVDNPQSKQIIGDAQACDLLGVDYQTKLYRPPAIDFPRSASYVTTAKAYEEILLPAIRERIKSGMSAQDAMFNVFSKADVEQDQVITMAEAKVYSHTKNY